MMATSARARQVPAVITAALVWSAVTVTGAPAAHAATPTHAPVAPAATQDGSDGSDSDDGCGTANPCGGGKVFPRPGSGGSNVPAASREADSSQDESDASGLIGWLLDLLGITGHKGGSATANVATGTTDQLEPDSGPRGRVPARRPSAAAATTPVAANGDPVAAAPGGRASRPPRQPVLEMPAPDPVAKPAPRVADIPAQPVMPLPKRIEPAPSDLLLPADGPGRSKPGLLEQWSAARQEAKQRSGGTNDSSSGSKSSPAQSGSGGGGDSAAAAGTPAGVTATAGNGTSAFLGAMVTLTSSAVTAMAGPAAGEQTRDMLSGVVHQVESALAAGAPRAVSGQTKGPGGEDRARDNGDSQGEHANSHDSHAEKSPR